MSKKYIGLDTLYYWLPVSKVVAADANHAAIVALATEAVRIKNIDDAGVIEKVGATITFTEKGNNRIEESVFTVGSVSDIAFIMFADDTDTFQTMLWTANTPIKGTLIKMVPDNTGAAGAKATYVVVAGSFFGFSESDPNADVARFNTSFSASSNPRKVTS